MRLPDCRTPLPRRRSSQQSREQSRIQLEKQLLFFFSANIHIQVLFTSSQSTPILCLKSAQTEVDYRDRSANHLLALGRSSIPLIQKEGAMLSLTCAYMSVSPRAVSLI